MLFSLRDSKVIKTFGYPFVLVNVVVVLVLGDRYLLGFLILKRLKFVIKYYSLTLKSSY